MCPAPRRGMVRDVRLPLLVLAIFLLGAAPASAGSWLPGDKTLAAIGESPDITSHRTVAAADGTVTQLVEQATADGQKTYVVTRPPGGAFASTAGWAGGFSQIVNGPDGSVAVVTHEWTGNNYAAAKAYVRVKRPGGAFDTKTDLGTAGLQSVWPGFVSPDGAFWALGLDAATQDVLLLRRTPDGVVHSDGVIDTALGEKVTAASILRLPNGKARMAISTYRDYGDNVANKCKRDTTLYVASANPDGVGTEAVQIERGTVSENANGLACSASQHSYQDVGGVTLTPHVMAVSPSGETSIVYSGQVIQAGPRLVAAAARLRVAQDSDWHTGGSSDTVVTALMTPIGLAYAGETPVLLLLNSGGIQQSQFMNGAWTAPAYLGGQEGDVPAIVGSPDGRAMVAIWALPNAGSPISPHTVRAQIRRPDGTFGEPVAEGQTIFSDVWTDGVGDFGVTLEADADPSPAYNPVTYYRLYDGAAPKVSVNGPAGGAAGQSAGPFTATATDIWSEIPNPPAWTFSGGGDASGASVSHAFATGGHQSATAKVTDAAGNDATATTGLDVTPAPPTTRSGSTLTVPPKDTVKPVLTKVKIAFDRRKHIATLKFTLSEDATVKLTIEQGKKRAITITKKLKKGSRSIQTKRLKTKVRYRFSLLATDAAKNKSKVATLSRTFR
jgi:hypothetical protein